jgi:TRAP-type C4-dicarboxylate transport system permease small subunit
MQVFQTSPAMGMPMKYVYLAIPISLAIMILHAVDSIFNDILRFSKEDAPA